MNLYFVHADGRVVTPETGTILEGITRASIIELAGKLGHQVEERKFSIDEWRDGVTSGDIVEIFACGTAAVVTPVGSLCWDGGDAPPRRARTGHPRAPALAGRHPVRPGRGHLRLDAPGLLTPAVAAARRSASCPVACGGDVVPARRAGPGAARRRLPAARAARRGRHGRGPPGPPRRRPAGRAQGAAPPHRRRRRGAAAAGPRGPLALPRPQPLGRRDRRRRPVGRDPLRRDPLRAGTLAARARAGGGPARRRRPRAGSPTASPRRVSRCTRSACCTATSSRPTC